MNVEEMKVFVEANDIVMMKADKTKKSDWPEIDELLISLGNPSRQIPFYAIFPAGRANRPIVMDGLYASPDAFIKKLEEAAASIIVESHDDLLEQLARPVEVGEVAGRLVQLDEAEGVVGVVFEQPIDAGDAVLVGVE